MAAPPPLFALEVYHLAFQEPVLVDPVAPSIPSDALFATLAAAWGQSQGRGAAEDAWWEPFRAGRPPFLLTSAFPFGGRVRFYPWPPGARWLWPPAAREQAQAHALDPTARFFSAGILARALQGQDPTPELLGPAAYALHEGALRLSRGEWAEKLAPVVAGDALWTVTPEARVAFAPGAGLWFGVWWRKEGPKTLSDGTPWAQVWQTALAHWTDHNPWGRARCVTDAASASGAACAPLLRPILPQVVRGAAYLLSRCAAPSGPGAPQPLAVHPVLGTAASLWDAGSLVDMPQSVCGQVVETATARVYGYALGLPWPM